MTCLPSKWSCGVKKQGYPKIPWMAWRGLARYRRKYFCVLCYLLLLCNALVAPLAWTVLSGHTAVVPSQIAKALGAEPQLFQWIASRIFKGGYIILYLRDGKGIRASPKPLFWW